jgi:RNA polymerase sigma-70 factor (ECF subfamily)
MTPVQPNLSTIAADAAFARLAEPHRRELKLHCYRMVGSLHEAEDLVQETFLRAWRAYGSFDGRGTLRAWLYRIATNASLDAIAARGNRGLEARLLPDQRAPAAEALPGVPAAEAHWLEPYPDAQFEGIVDTAPGPEARYAGSQAVRLAFVAALQQLPPRQRAVLLLVDVLGWTAAETATLLGGSVASINSALQRARDSLDRHPPAANPLLAPMPAREQDLLARYLRAWETLDLDGLVGLLKEDASYMMPPAPQWYQGRTAIRRFFAWAWPHYESCRMLATRANGQPAFAAYARAQPRQPWTAHSIHVLSLDAAGIGTLTLFYQPAQRIFADFGMPLALPDPAV